MTPSLVEWEKEIRDYIVRGYLRTTEAPATVEISIHSREDILPLIRAASVQLTMKSYFFDTLTITVKVLFEEDYQATDWSFMRDVAAENNRLVAAMLNVKPAKLIHLDVIR